MTASNPLGALFFTGHAAEEAVEIADELVENSLINMKKVLHQFNCAR